VSDNLRRRGFGSQWIDGRIRHEGKLADVAKTQTNSLPRVLPRLDEWYGDLSTSRSSL
jgi:hypothetical protein